jgi:hypothetical protein
MYIMSMAMQIAGAMNNILCVDAECSANSTSSRYTCATESAPSRSADAINGDVFVK